MKIYSATQEDGYWADIEELPFNSNEFTSCHPTLSGDARRLYFASNRPGGYGGLDIYVSYSNGGSWSEPINLGPTVNSSGNELFPYMAEDETLYYASNGHRGIGGLDIFKAQKVDVEDEGSWSIRENLGKQFNTKRDDFGFWISRDHNYGYLSSNRKKGNGGDDIYKWTSDDTALGLGGYNKEICVFEDGTSKRISGANVRVVEVDNNTTVNGNNKDLMLTLKPISEDKKEYVLSVMDVNGEDMVVEKSMFSDDNGLFNHKIFTGKQYRFIVEKGGYIMSDKVVSYNELMASSGYCIPLKKRTCMNLNGVVKNKEYGKPMPNAEVKVLNKCTGEEQKYTTGDDGAFTYCVECGCEYRMSAFKSGFDSDTEFLFPKDENCDPTNNLETVLELGVRKVVKVETAPPVEATPPPPVQYVPKVTYVPRTIYEPVTTYVPANEWTPDMLSNHFLGNESSDYREGMLIELKDIYYDFDKYNIRLDASKDLDRLLQLLRTYPSMHVSLEAHTDSRGTKAYNKNLSANRAKEARAYLVSRGIDSDRLTSQGFGESQPTNHCADGVTCDEQEHQANRRTEVRITKFDRTDIPVQYKK